jgi:hypothetical protein
MSETIYMPLLNEGTEVWRPVAAIPLGDGRYRVAGEMPEDEEWEFLPGDAVIGRARFFGGEQRIVAVEKIGSYPARQPRHSGFESTSQSVRPTNEQHVASLSGMTVNERLFYVGLFDQWTSAARRRDREAMVDILKRVEVPEPTPIIDTILADPKKYGF